MDKSYDAPPFKQCYCLPCLWDSLSIRSSRIRSLSEPLWWVRLSLQTLCRTAGPWANILVLSGKPFLMTKSSQKADFCDIFWKCAKYNSLQMKGWWESIINFWFPFMYSIPRNEIVRAASLFPKQNYNVLSPNSYTHISVRDFQDRSVYFAAAKYVDRSWEYVNRSQTHECRNWDWDRTIPFLGIHKLDFRYSFEIIIGNIAWDLSAKNKCVTSAYQNITSSSLRNMFIVYFSITWRTWLYPALRGDRVLPFPDTPHRNF